MLSNPTIQKTTVALIDDCKEDREFYKHLLNQSNTSIDIYEFADAQSYLDNVNDKVDCLLLDYNLPDMNAMELLKYIDVSKVPVIIMTGQGNEQIAAAVFKEGVYDYVVKSSIKKENLLNTVFMCLDRFKLDKQLEEQNKEAYYHATHDKLTGFYNRHYFEQQGKRFLNKAYRHREKLACFFLDLDSFKEINDTYGHNVGDNLLVQFSQRLKGILRKEDIIARVGGDEFSLLIDSFSSEMDLAYVARKILRETNRAYQIEGIDLHIGVSIGIYVYLGDQSLSFEKMLNFADEALYSVKDRNKNGFAFYSKDMDDNYNRRQYITNTIGEAIRQGRIELRFEEEFELRSKKTVGYEIFYNWPDSKVSNICEREFRAILEESNQFEYFNWACKQIIKAIQENKNTKEYYSINLFSNQLLNFPIIEELSDMCSDLDKDDRKRIYFEISESDLFHAPDTILIQLQHLVDLGFSLSLDHFGSYYTTFNDICSVPFSCIKICNTIVNGVHVCPKNQKVVKTIIAVAKTISAEVVALGIQSSQEQEYLIEAGCTLGQRNNGR